VDSSFSAALTVSLCILLVAPLPAGQPGAHVCYIGGTVSGLEGKTEGLVQTNRPEVMLFLTRKARYQIPYEKINLLEYGQQASRRFAMAIVISPIFLLSKKRKHFLTVGYTDENGQQQAMVFQVDKGEIRAVLACLEARTGLKVEYQDNEARRAGKGG
jgi:hypothetical protein